MLDLSCRKRGGDYYVVTDRWQRFSSLALSEAALAGLAASCDEFLVHGVDVEGMQLGIDDELVALLGRWSPVPVTYAGGARTLVRRAGGAVARGGAAAARGRGKGGRKDGRGWRLWGRPTIGAPIVPPCCPPAAGREARAAPAGWRLACYRSLPDTMPRAWLAPTKPAPTVPF